MTNKHFSFYSFDLYIEKYPSPSSLHGDRIRSIDSFFLNIVHFFWYLFPTLLASLNSHFSITQIINFDFNWKILLQRNDFLFKI